MLILHVVITVHLVREVGILDTSIFRLRWNNLNRAMAWKQLHVWRTIDEHFTRNRRQRVRQRTQLFTPMSKAAIIVKLAHSSLLKVSAHLSLIIGVYGSYIVSSGIVLRHRLIN